MLTNCFFMHNFKYDNQKISLTSVVLALIKTIVWRESVFSYQEDSWSKMTTGSSVAFSFQRQSLWNCVQMQLVLEYNMMKSHLLPLPTQLLTALELLATGTFQMKFTVSLNLWHLSQRRAIPAVLEGINHRHAGVEFSSWQFNRSRLRLRHLHSMNLFKLTDKLDKVIYDM